MASIVSRLKEEARKAEKREDWSRAIELYREALERSEESGDISLDLSLYNRIGDLYRRRGDTDEAVRFYRRAVRQYADQGLHTGAVALCNKILRLAPDHVDIYRVLGRLHATSGLAAEARNAFSEYVERMEERGDRSAAQDGRLELARLLDDDELLLDLLGRMASSGREEAAREAVADIWDEQRDRPDGPDPRLRELAVELGVDPAGSEPGGPQPEGGAGGGDAEQASAPEPEEAPGEGDAADAGGEAGDEAPRADGEPAGDDESADEDSGETPDAAPQGEEEDVEGVELQDILLHDPSTRSAPAEKPDAPTAEEGEGEAGPDGGDEADGRPAGDPATEPDAASGAGAPERAGEDEGGEAPRAHTDEGPEPRERREADGAGEDRGGAAEGEPVDLGDRIRRRLDAAPRRAGAEEVPDPGDFDDILVGFRAQAAETSGQADPAAHVELGVALRQMGLLEDAIREFQVAARADDPPLRALELLGESFLEKGLHSVAVRVLNRALRLPGYSDPELLGILYQLGVAYQRVDDREQALDCFERVYSVDIDFRDVAERMEAVRSEA